MRPLFSALLLLSLLFAGCSEAPPEGATDDGAPTSPTSESGAAPGGNATDNETEDGDTDDPVDPAPRYLLDNQNALHISLGGGSDGVVMTRFVIEATEALHVSEFVYDGDFPNVALVRSFSYGEPPPLPVDCASDDADGWYHGWDSALNLAQSSFQDLPVGIHEFWVVADGAIDWTLVYDDGDPANATDIEASPIEGWSFGLFDDTVTNEAPPIGFDDSWGDTSTFDGAGFVFSYAKWGGGVDAETSGSTRIAQGDTTCAEASDSSSLVDDETGGLIEIQTGVAAGVVEWSGGARSDVGQSSGGHGEAAWFVRAG